MSKKKQDISLFEEELDSFEDYDSDDDMGTMVSAAMNTSLALTKLCVNVDIKSGKTLTSKDVFKLYQKSFEIVLVSGAKTCTGM